MILGAALVVPMIFVHIAGYIKVGPVPPKELHGFGGVIIVKDGEKEVLFIDIKKISGAKLEKSCSKVIE